MRGRVSLAALLSLVGTAQVLPVVAEPFEVDRRSGTQHDQTVVYNPGPDDFFVFWADVRTGDVLGRRWRMREGEVEAVGPRRIYETGANEGGNQPAGAFDSAGKLMLLVWQEDRPNSTAIVGAFVNKKGKVIGGSFDVFEEPPCLPVKPGVAYNGAQDLWVVVWAYISAPGCPAPGIEGRAVDRDHALTPVERISGRSVDATPNIAYHEAEDLFLVTYASGEGVWVRRLKSSGAPRGRAVQVTPHADKPNVGYDPVNEQFLVTYQDRSEAVSHIAGHVVNHKAKIQPAFEIGSGREPGVGAFDSGLAWSAFDGSFLDVYESNPDGDDDLFGQVVRDGAKSGSAFLVVGDPGDEKGNTSRGRFHACSSVENLCLVVYETDRFDPQGDLFGTFVTLP
jgi:hypothetical protein